MFEEDYIMRQIHQMIQVLMKFLFNLDGPDATIEMIKDADTQQLADDILKKIDSGNIVEAEVMLFSLVKNKSMDSLMAGLVFYSYINQKDDEFLEKNNYNHIAAKKGMKRLLKEYNLEYMSELFISDCD